MSSNASALFEFNIRVDLVWVERPVQSPIELAAIAQFRQLLCEPLVRVHSEPCALAHF